MMLDFTKAFDSLEWNFLFNVLQKFNFGESFIKWIQTLYDDPITCIKTMVTYLGSLVYNVVLGKDAQYRLCWSSLPQK